MFYRSKAIWISRSLNTEVDNLTTGLRCTALSTLTIASNSNSLFKQILNINSNFFLLYQPKDLSHFYPLQDVNVCH
jgi:hypothetical protein